MLTKSKENSNITMLSNDAFRTSRDVKIKGYRKKWEQNPIDRITDQFPIHLDIESTSICDLKCPFCAGTHNKYPRGSMSMDLFQSIIDEGASRGLYSVKLNFRGEPLLHPDLAGMISYAKSKGIIDIFFNTNATHLTEKQGVTLIESGLDRLIISFEGFNKEIYEKNRVGASFDEVVKNVRQFTMLKRKLKSSKPLVRLQTVEIELIPSYLTLYKKFWQNWAEEITCIDLRDETGEYSAVTSDSWTCPYPWLRLLITWDGKIFTCPFVNLAENKYTWKGLGQIGKTTVEECWHGLEMNTIRKCQSDHLSHTIEPCKFCSYRGTEILKTEPTGS